MVLVSSSTDNTDQYCSTDNFAEGIFLAYWVVQHTATATIFLIWSVEDLGEKRQETRLR